MTIEGEKTGWMAADMTFRVSGSFELERDLALWRMLPKA